MQIYFTPSHNDISRCYQTVERFFNFSFTVWVKVNNFKNEATNGRPYGAILVNSEE